MQGRRRRELVIIVAVASGLLIVAALLAMGLCLTLVGRMRGAIARRLVDDPFNGLRVPLRPRRDRRTIVAIAEVERFALLRHRIGFRVASAIMAELHRRVTIELPDVWIGRVGRVTIEFAFDADHADDALEALETVRRALEKPIDIEGFRFDLAVIIGAADLGPEPVGEESIDIAAAALVDARQAHQSVRIAGAHAPHDHVIDVLALVRELPEAIQAGALELHYQPKLRARTNAIESAEGLLRWTHPRIGPVPIEALVRVAEETGAIRGLTEWVIARAVTDRATLAALGHDLTLYVNISGQLLPDPHFAARALALVGDASTSIGFEITETAVIGDPDRALANLQAFKDAGIRIAIDDYGSGLSSLAYLKQLPAQELKIDRLFIKELIDSHRDPLLVRSSIDLAHALEMEVTAEGVDDPMTLALLRIMGCDMVQGFLISPAVPLDQLIAIVADTERLAALDAADRQNLAAFGTVWSGNA